MAIKRVFYFNKILIDLSTAYRYNKQMKSALTIAGSDPTCGAGLQMDIRVFNALGVYGLSAISALTAQNTFNVAAVSGIDREFLEAQLRTLLDDIRPDALKTGMLFSVDAITAVAEIIREYGLENLVIDPVTLSSTGASLMESGVLQAMKTELFPLAKVITPNILEASVISGITIANENDLETAASVLKNMGPETVVITGGHLDLLPALKRETDSTIELLYDGQAFHRVYGEKVSGEFHGTGCAFSAAITALLALGYTIPDAVAKAKEFVVKAVRDAHAPGKGMKLLHV
jgi:hydroxymethylpyrimidine/phosphomethylpyrimidine kinase